MTIHHKKHAHLLTLLTVATLAIVTETAIMVGPAVAFTGYSVPTFFGVAGSGEGQFRDPAGVAVNDVTKDVYVYDGGNLRVEWFNAAGSKFEGQFNGSGSATGPFAPPARLSEHASHGTLFNLAIDNDVLSPSAGDVYVVDPGHDVVDKFTATGTYLSQLTGFKAPIFGIAVDTVGDVWVEEEGRESPENHGAFQEFDNGLVNEHLTEIVAEKLRSPGIVLDSEQNLYVLKGEPDVVKFTKTGSFVTELTGCSCDRALALNSETNELLVGQNAGIARFGPFGTSFEETIAGVSFPYGVAVDGTSATRDLYATQREADSVAIFKFGRLPEAITVAASGAQRTAVELEGEVNPEGQEVTICKFEYGTSEAYGRSVPCAQTPGSGSSPVSAIAPVTGLTAQTTYHFRLVAGNVTGAHAGSDHEFTTKPAVENLHTDGAVTVTGHNATLQGSLEPNGFDTHYFFEYGPTETYGFTGPVADAGLASGTESVSGEVGALEPHEEYHYRLVGENEFGKTYGEDEIFTTAPLAPSIPGSPSISLVSSQSADLNASLNPEHLTTRYQFEYGPCPALAACPTAQTTPVQESGLFGMVATIVEVAGLQPDTVYSYRLVASNEAEEEGHSIGGRTVGPEATFTTAPAPAPSAQTGGYGALGSTTVTISGSVDPDGAPVTYSFELGVYEGAATQYGVIASGSAGAGSAPVEETAALSGLQPATTYSYRIAVNGGDIDNPEHTLQGAPVVFTTPGLPTLLSSPPAEGLLHVPAISFPGQASPTVVVKKTIKCAKGKKLTHGKCTRPKTKAKHKPKKSTKRT